MATRGIDGKPIINAKKPLVLHVTENDAVKADRKHPADCVVARACRRELHAKEVRVHLSRVYVRINEGSWTRYDTPQAMRDEIFAFDRGGTFSPGTFELKPPRQDRPTGKRQGSKPKYARAILNPNRKARPAPRVVRDVRAGPWSE